MLGAIQRACEQQVEIIQLQLQLCYAVNATSRHVMEDFLRDQSGGGEDPCGGVSRTKGGNEHEGSDGRDNCDKGGNGKKSEVETDESEEETRN